MGALTIDFAILSVAIVLARLMFWSECGRRCSRRSIERAPIKEPRKHRPIVSNLDYCATAIAVDSSSMLQMINMFPLSNGEGPEGIDEW